MSAYMQHKFEFLGIPKPKLKEIVKPYLIDFQQEYKAETNTDLLEKIICNNLGSDEFFINKAIGWSLRDYSKLNAEWVKAFLVKYKEQLSTLSTKEASKYLNQTSK